jgi:hypothetical protein
MDTFMECLDGHGHGVSGVSLRWRRRGRERPPAAAQRERLVSLSRERDCSRWTRPWSVSMDTFMEGANKMRDWSRGGHAALLLVVVWAEYARRSGRLLSMDTFMGGACSRWTRSWRALALDGHAHGGRLLSIDTFIEGACSRWTRSRRALALRWRRRGRERLRPASGLSAVGGGLSGYPPTASVCGRLWAFALDGHVHGLLPWWCGLSTRDAAGACSRSTRPSRAMEGACSRRLTLRPASG